jgi:GNAT superfamily N-acetyltransferase
MKLEWTDRIEPQDEEAIYQGLLEYNLARLEDKKPRQLGAFLRESDGTPAAGLIGMTHGKWLSIHYLWVSDPLRGQGVGSRLLKEAEEEALRRGCRYAFVDTFQFQAPAFYEKRGYRRAFVLTEYPLTGKRFYYTKQLLQPKNEKKAGSDF